MSAFPKRETHFFVWGATPETDAFALAEWLGRSFCTGSLRKGGCLLFSHAVAHFARAFARQLAKLAIEAGQGHIAPLGGIFPVSIYSRRKALPLPLRCGRGGYNRKARIPMRCKIFDAGSIRSYCRAVPAFRSGKARHNGWKHRSLQVRLRQDAKGQPGGGRRDVHACIECFSPATLRIGGCRAFWPAIHPPPSERVSGYRGPRQWSHPVWGRRYVPP